MRRYKLQAQEADPIRRSPRPRRTLPSARREPSRNVYRTEAAPAAAPTRKAGGAPERLARLRVVVASDAELPGYFGSVKLVVDRDSVDLSRLRDGVLPVLADHDARRPIGSVRSASVSPGELSAVVDIYDVDGAAETLRQIRAPGGLRKGISPGFIIQEAHLEPSGGDDVGTFVITKWQPFEISTTPIPKNQAARILSEE